jgi:hypothetical protein
MLIINEDNDHYFKQPAKLMNVADLQAYIDRLAGTKVTHFFMCPNGQRTSYRSAVHEAIWDPIDGQAPDNIWCVNAKILFDKGIDPYAVWIKRCREKGISPWITMRMNDVHFVTTKNYFRNTTFWRDRPDLWRVPNCTSGHWFDYAFDYSRPEVREYHMALIRELLERYNMDGLELDWMRFGRHLTPGKEAEQAPILTEFVRLVRQLSKEWAAKRGHAIGLSVRIPAHPDAAAGLGMDGVTWANEGLVDLLVVSPFFSSADFDTPIELWRERLGDSADKVRIVPAIDNGTSAYPGAPRVDVDLAMYYGWAEALRQRGADSFYLFNLVYRPQDKPPYRTILDHGLAEDVLLANPRRYPLAYLDTVPDGFPTGAQLPKMTNQPVALSLRIGQKPTSGSVSVVIGLADRPGVAEAVFSASLNGQAATGCSAAEKPHTYGGKKTVRALRFTFPPTATRDAVNAAKIEMTSGEPQRIVWAELATTP